MRDIEHGCASMAMKKLLEITVAFGLTLETLYYLTTTLKEVLEIVYLWCIGSARPRAISAFPCITCGLAICGAAGMAVLRALWSELEDFEANHLNSDCFLKEEPSLYWKVWPIGHWLKSHLLCRYWSTMLPTPFPRSTFISTSVSPVPLYKSKSHSTSGMSIWSPV